VHLRRECGGPAGRACWAPVTEAVAAGYDAVYAAWSSSARFHGIWARNTVDGEIAAGFEHLADVERLRESLDLRAGAHLVDLACGVGSPGAWVALQTGAILIGVDMSRVGTGLAARRVVARDLPGGAFVVGSVGGPTVVSIP
jgi:hypothetical protein